MKRPVILSLLLLPLLITAGCRQGKTRTEPYHVLVMHCYDSLDRNYRIYDKELSRSLKRNGIRAEIKNVYREMGASLDYRNYSSGLAKLKQDGWVPDVICFFDARTLSLHLEGLFSEWLPPTNSVPIVASGLHSPDYELIRQYKNIYVQTDLIDFMTNLRLAVDMVKDKRYFNGVYSNLVHIELDYTNYDIRVRNELLNKVNVPPFVNNADFHISGMTFDQIFRTYKDSIFIDVFSNRHPERNAYDGDYLLYHKRALQNLRASIVLSVKKDMDSAEILKKSQRPQLTAIRDGFGNGYGRLLCGYFASYKTVAHDQADFVARVLKGEQVASMSFAKHEPDYYMDWDAMKQLGMKSREFRNGKNMTGHSFNIVNAPFRIMHPILFFLMVAVVIAAVAAIVLFINYKLFRSKKIYNRFLAEQLDGHRNLFNLMFDESSAIIVNDVNDIASLEDRIHPEDRNISLDIIRGLAEGEKVIDKELRISINSGNDYHWWRFLSAGEGDNPSVGGMKGVLIDVDDSVDNNNIIQETRILAQELANKETFLKNISHEIRTPLNSIVGFSQLLGADDGSMSEEDKGRIGGFIRENTLVLSDMIEDILQYSRLESGRIDIDMVETEIAPLMESIFSNWQERVPEGIDFHLNAGFRNIFAMLDPVRVSTIIGHYIRNAIRYTSSGSIIVGWNYNISDGMVSLYVQDTGIGISENKQKLVYNLFWKDDQYQNGVGIGLSISKLYTEKMNGFVRLQSTEGVGSSFSSVFKAYIRKDTQNR